MASENSVHEEIVHYHEVSTVLRCPLGEVLPYHVKRIWCSQSNTVLVKMVKINSQFTGM